MDRVDDAGPSLAGICDQDPADWCLEQLQYDFPQVGITEVLAFVEKKRGDAPLKLTNTFVENVVQLADKHVCRSLEIEKKEDEEIKHCWSDVAAKLFASIFVLEFEKLIKLTNVKELSAALKNYHLARKDPTRKHDDDDNNVATTSNDDEIYASEEDDDDFVFEDMVTEVSHVISDTHDDDENWSILHQKLKKLCSFIRFDAVASESAWKDLSLGISCVHIIQNSMTHPCPDFRDFHLIFVVLLRDRIVTFPKAAMEPLGSKTFLLAILSMLLQSRTNKAEEVSLREDDAALCVLSGAVLGCGVGIHGRIDARENSLMLWNKALFEIILPTFCRSVQRCVSKICKFLKKSETAAANEEAGHVMLEYGPLISAMISAATGYPIGCDLYLDEGIVRNVCQGLSEVDGCCCCDGDDDSHLSSFGRASLAFLSVASAASTRIANFVVAIPVIQKIKSSPELCALRFSFGLQRINTVGNDSTCASMLILHNDDDKLLPLIQSCGLISACVSTNLSYSSMLSALLPSTTKALKDVLDCVSTLAKQIQSTTQQQQKTTETDVDEEVEHPTMDTNPGSKGELGRLTNRHRECVLLASFIRPLVLENNTRKND